MGLVKLMACALALGLAGCGGDDGDGDARRFACDVGAGTDTPACYGWSWNGPATGADAYTGVCGSAGGATPVSACPATGKVGGCRYDVSSGSHLVTWIGWFYFGTAAEGTSACVGAGGTWVNP
jgi:hypothetical protein